MKKRHGFGTGSQQAAVPLGHTWSLACLTCKGRAFSWSVRSHTISPRWLILSRFLWGTKCWEWSPRHRHLHTAKCSATEFHPKPPEERMFRSLIWYQKEIENGRNTGVFILWPPVESKGLYLGELREQGPHPEAEFQRPRVLGMKTFEADELNSEPPAMTPHLLLDFLQSSVSLMAEERKEKVLSLL